MPLTQEASAIRLVRHDDVPLAQVLPSPHQPRKQMDPLVLSALQESILAVGVMQRPRVRELEGKYELVFGHQRAEACRLLGWESLPVEVIECDDLTARRMTLHENIKSTRLHPIEHAEGICKFLDATLCADPGYSVVPGASSTERIFHLLTGLTKAPAEGEDESPVRTFALGHSEHIHQIIREMANKEPRSFLSADVSLLQLPEEILFTTIQHGLKKGHARVLGELMAKEPAMFEEVMAHGVPSEHEGGYTPLEQAPVAAIRGLYKPPAPKKDFSAQPLELDSHQAYVPMGGPQHGVAPSDEMPPWDDEPLAAPTALPLAALRESHNALTTMSPAEWAAMILEAAEGEKNDARRQWENIRRWADGVLRAFEEGPADR